MPSIDFGIQIEPQYGFTFSMIREIAKTAEELGFGSIWVSDHLFMTQDSIDINCLECWTTLARAPGALTRIKQLREVIEIAKRLWTEDKVSYKGDYYAVEEALCYPQPVQDPHIPIWVGGMGNHTLKVAAEHADAVNFAWSTQIERFSERLQVLEDHCSQLGTEYEAIRKSAGLMITMAPTKEELREKLEEQERNKDTPYRRYLNRQPPNIVGVPDQVKNSIEEYVEIGVDHFILRFNFREEIESMRLFTENILPEIN